MNFFNALVLLILIQGLLGCVSNRCLNAGGYKTVIKHVDSGEKLTDFDDLPVRSYSGIQSANIVDENLSIRFIDKALFEEYTGPVINEVAIRSVAGCPDDIMNYGKVPDKSKMIKTGKSEWRASTVNHKILVSGLNKDYEFFTDRIIDLSFAILDSNLTTNTELKITCLDCNLSSYTPSISDTSLNTSVKINNDFRPVKTMLMKSAKYNQYLFEREEVKRQSDQKVLELKAERQKQGVILDEFKIKCQSLGFKVGSKDFGNCVLDLNDIK